MIITIIIMVIIFLFEGVEGRLNIVIRINEKIYKIYKITDSKIFLIKIDSSYFLLFRLLTSFYLLLLVWLTSLFVNCLYLDAK